MNLVPQPPMVTPKSNPCLFSSDLLRPSWPSLLTTCNPNDKQMCFSNYDVFTQVVQNYTSIYSSWATTPPHCSPKFFNLSLLHPNLKVGLHQSITRSIQKSTSNQPSKAFKASFTIQGPLPLQMYTYILTPPLTLSNRSPPE